MIVIATNNGSTHLPRLLKSIEAFGCGKQRVLVVDTGSTDPAFLDYLDSLQGSPFEVTRTPYRGYDTGAYIWAYQNYADDGYIFMHDSMEVLASGWEAEFPKVCKDICYYAYFSITFPLGFDSEEQIANLHRIGVLNTQTRNCAFGPIFYASRSAMDALAGRFDLSKVIPRDKLEQQGMERGWSMMADTCAIPVGWLGDTSTLVSGVHEHIFHPCLKKYRPTRS